MLDLLERMSVPLHMCGTATKHEGTHLISATSELIKTTTKHVKCIQLIHSSLPTWKYFIMQAIYLHP